MKVLINWQNMISAALLMLLTVQSAWAGMVGTMPVNGNGLSMDVPEPATLGILALGIAGIALARRKKK